MRIAQVAPLAESVPPLAYGGTERVVSYLTEELVAMGHDVTLFASGGSVTRARLVPVCPRSLRLDPGCTDRLAHHIVLLARVFAEAHNFDILHFHIDYLHFPLSRRSGFATVTTLHGRLDLPDLVPVYREFSDLPLVSISDAQRGPLPWPNWIATVHHGLPWDLHRPSRPSSSSRGDYLAFLGRISPEKRVDRAIEIAQRAGMNIRIAAKVDPVDGDYSKREIEPLLGHPGVEFLGEVDDAGKHELLSGARALLFPIDWPEPFGLVMIEAMACGTPVIAFRRGSVPEVITDGVTGFVVDGVDEAVEAVGRLDEVSRARCREEFERRFTAARMARDYLAVYEKLINARTLGNLGGNKPVPERVPLPEPKPSAFNRELTGAVCNIPAVIDAAAPPASRPDASGAEPPFYVLPGVPDEPEPPDA